MKFTHLKRDKDVMFFPSAGVGNMPSTNETCFGMKKSSVKLKRRVFQLH